MGRIDSITKYLGKYLERSNRTPQLIISREGGFVEARRSVWGPRTVPKLARPTIYNELIFRKSLGKNVYGEIPNEEFDEAGLRTIASDREILSWARIKAKTFGVEYFRVVAEDPNEEFDEGETRDQRGGVRVTALFYDLARPKYGVVEE